jgi:hypothetical protein
MFRIKTDIRQYKCETKDKVEKLIRNWVIRPSDLIYNVDEREWLPIGEHPAFVNLFGVLEEQEQNTPDTVVTARSPYSDRPSADRPNGTDAVGDADSEEVTHVVERPEFDDEEEDDEEREEPEREEPEREEPEEDAVDARETDVFDEEEIAASLADDKPQPPEAPEGVEPPSNDEVTMMTEKTLEMLKVDDDDASEATEDDETGEREAPETDEDEEVTDVRERDTDEEEEDDAPPSVVVEGLEPDDETPTDERLGRHDLPEELFATNEISSPVAQDQLKRIDDLAELSSEPSEATEEETEEHEARDSLQQDSGVDEAWDVIAEDLRATEDLSETSDAEAIAALRETDELDRADAAEEDALEEVEAEPLGEWGDQDDEDGEETAEPEVHPADFISDGYKIPLPFPIEPTPADIEKGLRPTRVSKSRKERTFPLPEPKTPDEVHRRTWDLTPAPPRDQTVLITIGLLIIITFIAAITMC